MDEKEASWTNFCLRHIAQQAYMISDYKLRHFVGQSRAHCAVRPLPMNRCSFVPGGCIVIGRCLFCFCCAPLPLPFLAEARRERGCPWAAGSRRGNSHRRTHTHVACCVSQPAPFRSARFSASSPVPVTAPAPRLPSPAVGCVPLPASRRIRPRNNADNAKRTVHSEQTIAGYKHRER
jgi:hypothetical protein